MFWLLCLFSLLPGLGCRLCSEERGCVEDGSNALFIVSGLETESVCQELCAATEECRVFTWYGDYQVQAPWFWRQDCVLLQDCGQQTQCQSKKQKRRTWVLILFALNTSQDDFAVLVNSKIS